MARFSKVPKTFGPKKPFVKFRPAYSVKLVFSYVVKVIKIKINAKFQALRRLRFEDTKRTMSPEMRPKSSGTFEKRAPELQKELINKTEFGGTPWCKNLCPSFLCFVSSCWSFVNVSWSRGSSVFFVLCHPWVWLKNLFMLSVRISSYGCTREVWRARKMRKICTRR